MKYLDLPKLRQTYEYDCGASALQSILAYYGIEINEARLIKKAKTNKVVGTRLDNILKTLKYFQLSTEVKSMTIEDLKHFISQKIPVIILLQAWKSSSIDYQKDFKDNHWVVVKGYTADHILFEDPYSFETTYLTYPELLARWHAIEGKKKLLNIGIAVYGKKPKYNSDQIIHMD